MYNHSNQSYFHTIKRIGIALFTSFYVLPSSAQFAKDSLLIQFMGSEAAVEDWKKTQKDAYAFDHLLQKPAVAKHYKHKKFGDHLFIEGGAQTLFNISHSSGNGAKDNFYPSFYFGIGDWMTPLHGWRLSLHSGNYKYNRNYSKILGASLDYMLNFHAVAADEYDQPKTFEMYGIAGVDAMRSESTPLRAIDYAWGLHVGLRGQVHFNPYTYFFIEPRLGVASDDLIHTESWRNYILTANAIAGLGYRLNPTKRVHNAYHTSGHFLDNTFVSFSGGGSSMLNIGKKNGFSSQFGALGQVSFGKWFNPYSALRITAGAALREQPEYSRVKAVTAGIGYLWNMHNTFAGYDPDRRYWVNAVADVNANISTSGSGRKNSYGFGAGLQPNVRVGKGVELFLEPRIDFYTDDYADYVGENSHFDVYASILAGVTFRQGTDSREQIRRNDDFESKSWYDNLFVEGGFGGIMPISRSAGKDLFKYVGPNAHIGIGKWFNATSGLRLWGEIGQYKPIRDNSFEVFGIGADYLWNLTNAIHGYVEDRPCELIASAGINTVANGDNKNFYFGGNLGLKGVWHLNNMLGLYLEPQLRIYDEHMLAHSSFPIKQVDVLGQLMAGIQLRMNGYRPGAYLEEFDGDERRSFVSLSAGTTTNMKSPRTPEQYAALARISFGNWYSPVSAWRINFGALGRPKINYREAMVNAGADYMADLTTLAYGYNPDRIISIRYILGANIGLDYKIRTDHKMHFTSDLHTGGQVAFRAGRKNEIFIEPQLSCTVLSDIPNLGKKERINAAVYAGITHKLYHSDEKKAVPMDEETDDFVKVSVGSGLNSSTMLKVAPRVRRLTIDFDASYGHWFNSVSGIRAGLSHSNIFRFKGEKNLQLTSLHADYMLNLLTLCGGQQALDNRWAFNALAGVTFNIGNKKNMDTTFVPGLQAGLETGYKLNKHWELSAEASGNLMSRKIWRSSGRKIEGLGHLLLGTKYHF